MPSSNHLHHLEVLPVFFGSLFLYGCGPPPFVHTTPGISAKLLPGASPRSQLVLPQSGAQAVPDFPTWNRAGTSSQSQVVSLGDCPPFPCPSPETSFAAESGDEAG